MRVGVDVMGGDYAPEAAVRGVLEASKHVSVETVIVMFGCKEQIDEILSRESDLPLNIEIVNTTEVIEMNDSPTQAFTKKR
ncbi:MAG: phosphate--acyl-ACP acyltransferase, partial [Rikenellaceae bacterium]